eukprot:4289335-Pyramimonas_sp.AAC.1
MKPSADSASGAAIGPSTGSISHSLRGVSPEAAATLQRPPEENGKAQTSRQTPGSGGEEDLPLSKASTG